MNNFPTFPKHRINSHGEYVTNVRVKGHDGFYLCAVINSDLERFLCDIYKMMLFGKPSPKLTDMNGNSIFFKDVDQCGERERMEKEIFNM